MIVNFKVNEIAFSIFIVVLLLFILISSTSYLFVYDDCFEIGYERIIKKFNSKTIYYFKDIKSIEYSKSSFNLLNLIEYVPGTNKQKEFIIKYKDGSEEYLGIIGSKRKAIQAIEIINDKTYCNKKHIPSSP